MKTDALENIKRRVRIALREIKYNLEEGRVVTAYNRVRELEGDIQ